MSRMPGHPVRWALGLAVFCAVAGRAEPYALPPAPAATDPADPATVRLLDAFSEAELTATAKALEGLTSRAVGQPGNRRAAEYLFGRLKGIPGLTVEFQGGALSNVVATLPGTDPAAKAVFIIGAHYDSASSDPARAPGVTDDAAGIATVLEAARLLSGLKFRHTIQFACWNAEEDGLRGAAAFVKDAVAQQRDIGLYINCDSCGFDAHGRLVLDITSNRASARARDRMVANNTRYNLGFQIVHNRNQCGGDFVPFWMKGLRAVSTHQEEHGAHYHTPQDTLDKFTPAYTRKNGQLALSLLVELAGRVP